MGVSDFRPDADWQVALSEAVEELQSVPVLGLTRRERGLVCVYIRQMEAALRTIEGRCPDCLALPGATHYCYPRRTATTYDDLGIPEGDPRREARMSADPRVGQSEASRKGEQCTSA